MELINRLAELERDLRKGTHNLIVSNYLSLDDVAEIIESLKYQETVKQLGNIYIVPKDSTWIVNGIDIKEILKSQYLRSLEKMENNGSDGND